MISRTLLFSVAALSLALHAAPAARAENPLEKLHKKIFGDDDRRKGDDKRKKDRDRKDDRDEHRHDDRRRYDDDRYDDRYYRAPVTVERRIYVEPAPRRYDYYEPAPRTYAARSLEADVQMALRRQGFYRGPVDGDIGPGTRAAIRDYQYAQRLPVTGRIDTYLLRSLGL